MGQDSKDKKTLTSDGLVDKLIQYGSFARSHLSEDERFEFQREVVDVLYQARVYVEGAIETRSKFILEIYKLRRVVDAQLKEYSGDRAKLEELRRTKFSLSTGDFWYWEEDGPNNPESLLCPVVMQPECVRKLMRKIERLEAEKESLLEDLKQLQS